MIKRTLAIGDIHGRAQALKEVLDLSKFDYDNDRLIILGDIVDGGLESCEAVDLLLQIKNKVLLLGNHDLWFYNFINTDKADPLWLSQGGAATIVSYFHHYSGVPQSHCDFFSTVKPYFLDEDNNLYVHGGINPVIPLESNKVNDIIWNRSLISTMQKKPDVLEKYNNVFIGHTTTISIAGTDQPVRYNNLWCLDTGAGSSGRLTILDVKTKEFWQSEIQPSCFLPYVANEKEKTKEIGKIQADFN